jgi:hypothetical protein
MMGGGHAGRLEMLAPALKILALLHKENLPSPCFRPERRSRNLDDQDLQEVTSDKIRRFRPR